MHGASAGLSKRSSPSSVRRAWTLAPILWALVLIVAFAEVASARAKESRKFKYLGGMQMLLRGCVGDLELKSDALTFRCHDGTQAIPYASIELMQYRPSLSPKVRKMAIHWDVAPSAAMPVIPKKRNRYFAVIYTEAGNPQGLVLEVAPEIMQPYIAEIELKSNKRVEVYNHEEYY